MPKTPVRNVRIPDPLWNKLGKLAQKRNTSITALLIEAATLFLDEPKASKSTPVGATANEEALTRIGALEADFKGLEDHVIATEEQVRNEVHAKVQALEERLEALEAQVRLGVHVGVQAPLTEDAVQATVHGEVQAANVSPSFFYPLMQKELSQRLGVTDSACWAQRRSGDREHFAQWSSAKDPDRIAWTWEGKPGRGAAIKYVPKRD